MKVKELWPLVFSAQRVRILSRYRTVFLGWANELPDCEYKDSEVKQLYVGAIEKGQLCIEVKQVEAE